VAGHSKWANIKHRKARQDVKKAKIFTRLLREILVAARMNPDASLNPRLRAAVDKALVNNMKRDTIEKTIARAAGTAEGENYEELRYEGYAPFGVAVIVETMTDNKQRTVAEVRHAFSKKGGNMGTDGSVSYMFKKQGVISFTAGVDEDTVMNAALEAGADDVVTHEDGSMDVITTPEAFMDVKTALEAAGLVAEHADVVMEADVKVSLNAEETQKVLDLIDMMEDLDDVQEVYHNLAISEEVMAQLGD
jgi:YebC/PmpR family DNA-binding regulatory protein